MGAINQGISLFDEPQTIINPLHTNHLGFFFSFPTQTSSSSSPSSLVSPFLPHNSFLHNSPSSFVTHPQDSINLMASLPETLISSLSSSSSKPRDEHDGFLNLDHHRLTGGISSQRPFLNPWAWSSQAEYGSSQKDNQGSEADADDNDEDVGGGGIDDDDDEDQHHHDTGRRHKHNSGSVGVVSSMKMKKIKTRRKVREPRFCFKTLSEVDVLDDGYRWRKYGQKVVKNTQHPRSYYRCTKEKCRVKKRVERLAEDPRMVITSYEGRHLHSPPSSHLDDDSLSSSSSPLSHFFW